MKNNTIKTIVLSLSLVTSIYSQEKSDTLLLGRKLIQGNFNFKIDRLKNDKNQVTSSLISSATNNGINLGINCLFGQVLGQNKYLAGGFNFQYTDNLLKDYFTNGSYSDTLYTQNTSSVNFGPSLGVGKFISIKDGFYFAPITLFNLNLIYEKLILKDRKSINSNQVDPLEGTGNSIGGGANINIVPLRLAYLWNNKILFTTSIGSINALFEYRSTSIELSQPIMTNANNGNPIYTTSISTEKTKKLSADLNGNLLNNTSFGITYLF